MLTVEIPMPTVSLNRLQRMHYHARARLRAQYETVLRLSCAPQDRLAEPMFRHVVIERYGSRELDKDNFIGGCKPLVDALTRVGLIWDDSPSYVDIVYAQRKAAIRNARTVITVS